MNMNNALDEKNIEMWLFNNTHSVLNKELRKMFCQALILGADKSSIIEKIRGTQNIKERENILREILYLHKKNNLCKL